MTRTISVNIIALALLLFLPSSGYPSAEDICRPTKDKFYDDKERGWYYNEYCQKQKEKEKKSAETLQGKENLIGDRKKLRDPSYLDTLDVKTFKETFDQMKEETIHHPTGDNMLTYLTMQDFMKNKALSFSRVWQDVLLQYPEFNHTVKSPASNYGAMVKTFVQTRDNEKNLEQLNESAGVFLMVSGECSYCKYQADIANDLMVRYGIEIRTFSKDYCISSFSNCTVNPGMFDTFNIKVTPTVIAVYRERDDKPRFQLISTGLMTQSELVERLVYYQKNKQSGLTPD